MAEIGMDSDAVRGVATQLATQAQQLNAVASLVDRLIDQLDAIWVGGDAAEFAGWWRGQHRPALTACVQSLDGLASSARNNASAQDGTSAGDGGAIAAVLGVLRNADPLGTAGDVLGWITTAELGRELFTALRSAHITAPLSDLSPKTVWTMLGKGDGALNDFKGLDNKLGYVGLALGGVQVFQDFTSHASTGTKILDGSQEALDAVGMVVPEVGLAVGAFEAGAFIGTKISEIPAVHHQMDNYQNAVIAQGSKEVGGDVNTDSAAAQRLVDRYSGWSGPLHAVQDGLPSWMR